MISPRTWSEPPGGSNMLAEHPALPARTSRVLAREMASAIGAMDCCELDNDVDIQRIAANTIDAYMAKTIVDRTHARLLQVTDRFTPGELGSATPVAVLHTNRGRGNRGGEQARRPNGDHFYDSYHKINYDDWPDRRA